MIVYINMPKRTKKRRGGKPHRTIKFIPQNDYNDNFTDIIEYYIAKYKPNISKLGKLVTALTKSKIENKSIYLERHGYQFISVKFHHWPSKNPKIFIKEYVLDSKIAKASTENMVIKFMREVDAQSKSMTLGCNFETPALIGYYFYIEGTVLHFYIVSEYVDLTQYTAITNDNREDYIQYIDEVNDCLKQHGIVHNDLRNKNIAYNQHTGKMLIMDFGEAEFGINLWQNNIGPQAYLGGQCANGVCFLDLTLG